MGASQVGQRVDTRRRVLIWPFEGGVFYLGVVDSPQLKQNFVPGGSLVWQLAQCSSVFRLMPQEEQNLAVAVMFFSQLGHFLMMTI